jgi:hypothetical protein
MNAARWAAIDSASIGAKMDIIKLRSKNTLDALAQF